MLLRFHDDNDDDYDCAYGISYPIKFALGKLPHIGDYISQKFSFTHDNKDDDSGAENDDDDDDAYDDDDEAKSVVLQVEGIDDEALYGRNYLDWKKQTLTSQVSPLMSLFLSQSLTMVFFAQLNLSISAFHESSINPGQ